MTATPIVATAQVLRQRGYGIVWLRAGEKTPKRLGWQLKSQEPSDYTPGSNLGILCGRLSSNLVLVDIDTLKALELADTSLPPTGMIDGRPGKPRSHRWYVVTDIPPALTALENCAGGMGGPRSTKYSDPATNKAVVEFKATGQQAVVPPSIWTNGSQQEERVWYDAGGQVVAEPGEPAVIDCQTLFDAVYQLATTAGARPAKWVAALQEPAASPKSKKIKEPHGAKPKKEPKATVPTPPDALVQDGVLLIPLPDRIDVAAACIYHVPAARSGHGGHDMTFRVARALVNDCALPREDALAILKEYNQRLGAEGEEMWTEADLIHKIDSALAAPANPHFPFGCKVTAESITNPHRLAREFLAERPFRYWRDLYLEYDGKKYVHVADKEMRALLTGFIEARFRQVYQAQVARYERLLREWEAVKEGKPPKSPALMAVHSALLRDVTLAVNDLALLRGTYAMPCLLPEGKDHNYLALDNGNLDLDDGTLRPHTPDWFSTVCLPYPYIPGAKAPQWEAVLARNLEGDVQRIALLQEFFGYCLVKTTDGQACLILFGEGGNGKSVVLAVLRALLGADNISTVPLENFAQRFAMAQTLGMLANVCPEIGEIDRTAEGVLKSYISGDRMFFEKKGKDGFSAPPTARLVLATNSVPRFMDKSEGIWRRLFLMPMTVQIPQEERKVGLDKETSWIESGELPGILEWALAGLRRLRANGFRFTMPDVCKAALAEHRLESDPTRAFLLERYEAGDDAEPILARDLYLEYRLFCDTFGHRNPMNNISFGRQIRRLFPIARSDAVRCGSEGVQRYWRGLRPAQRVHPPAGVAGTAAAGHLL
jgi:P4 family phage/plasmid primase-like protien